MQVKKCNIQDLAYLLQHSTQTSDARFCLRNTRVYPILYIAQNTSYTYRQRLLYFQHTHFILIVGEGKRGAYLLLHGDLPRQHLFGTIMTLYRRTLGIERHRYAFA